MIRVGFIITNNGNGWMGGINYLTNLLHAVTKLNNPEIEPVLIVSPKISTELLDLFPQCEVVYTRLAGGTHRFFNLVQKFCKLIFGRNVPLEHFLKVNAIDVLSHSGTLGRNATLATIGWIPDFQHRRMPEFFNSKELIARDRNFYQIAQECTTVLLSSEDAQRDLAQFAPTTVSSSRVLHFVVGLVDRTSNVVNELALREQYDIEGPYFHLPNQFWIHKNHRLVIDALSVLKQKGHDVKVLCTGNTRDHRWPHYFDELMNYAESKGVTDRFLILGLVSYDDMIGLMKYSVGVINPSLFEGWSTTVEESKSLGLTIALSDIPVHREQNPDYGIYFDPYSSDSLVNTFLFLLNKHDIEFNHNSKETSKKLMGERFSLFGENYQSIVLETIQSFNR